MIHFLIFLSLVLSVYTLLVLYPYYRLLRHALPIPLRWLYLFVCVFAVVLLFLGRYADKNSYYSLSYWGVLLGLLWLGFSLYLSFSALLVDLYKGFVELSKRFLGINPLPKPSVKTALILVLLLSLSLSAYSYYETLNLKVIRITIYTHKLPEGMDSLKIMHISDTHLGPVMGMDKVRLVKEIWQREKPDIIVDTGDLVDGNLRDKQDMALELSRMSAPYGKFAVMGNHEYFRDWEHALEFMRSSGYRVLRNETVDLGFMKIVGIDDRTCKLVNACVNEKSETKLLRSVSGDGKFVLVLKHQPTLEPSSLGLFDLMLSGHTHGGVYLPVGWLILRRMFITDAGLVKVGSSYIFVSRGVGTGGPPMRFWAPPDVAIINLVNILD